MKRNLPALKLVRETVRELSGGELSQVAGGQAIGQSELPTCLCSSIPCGGPSQTLNLCIAVSGVLCG
jgi:hypothetical protein